MGKAGQQGQGLDNNLRGCNNTGGVSPRRRVWIDNHHPKIVTMMADYITARGTRIKLTEILDAANKRIMDLPMLPEYIENGHPFKC